MGEIVEIGGTGVVGRLISVLVFLSLLAFNLEMRDEKNVENFILLVRSNRRKIVKGSK